MDVDSEKRYNLERIEAGFKTYLSAGKKLSRNTIKNYLSDIRFFLGWFDGFKDSESNSVSELISSTDISDLEEYRQFFIKASVPFKTINRRLSALRLFFEYCKGVGIAKNNPAKLIRNIVAPELSGSHNFQIKQSTDFVANSAPIKVDTTQLLSLTKAKIPYLGSRKFNGKKRWLLLGLAIMLISLLLSQKGAEKIKINTEIRAQDQKDAKSVLYEGIITDNDGTPIFQKTKVSFAFYSTPEGGKSIYNSGVCEVLPNREGKIAVAIGQSCGEPIGSNILSGQSNIYLGITVSGDPEATPRQQVPNISYASSSESLMGKKLAPEAGATTQTIPYINEDGELALALENPRITSTDGVFQLSGKAISFVTTPGGSGNITLAPDVGGYTLLTKGNVGIGTSRPSLFKLQVAGDIGPNEDLRYDLGSNSKRFRAIYADKIFLGSDELSQQTTDSIWQSKNGVIAAKTTTFDILTGSIATNEANIKLAGKAGNTSFINQGNVGIGTRDPQAILDVAGTAHLRGATGTKGLFVNSKGFVGIGNTSPSFELDLTGQLKVSGLVMLGDNSGDSVISKATDWQWHHDTSFDLKNNSTSAFTIESGLLHFDTENSRIGIGTTTPTSKLHIVGGNCADVSGDATGCTADYAELYPTSELVEKGDLLAVDNTSDNFQLRKARADDVNRLIGVVSSYPAMVIDGGSLSFMNNDYELNPRRPAVALSGRVPVTIDPDSPIIKAGDRLTSSSKAGKARKATKSGPTFGIALENWQGDREKLLVFIDLSYFDPQTAIAYNGEIVTDDMGNQESPNVYYGTGKNVEQNSLLTMFDGFIFDNENRLLTLSDSFKNATVELPELIVNKAATIANLTVQSIDATIIYSEKILARNIETDKLTAKEAEVMRLRTNQLEAETIISKEIKTDQIEAKSLKSEAASINGTLTANHIESKNITNIEQSLLSTRELLSRLKENTSEREFSAEELRYLNLDQNVFNSADQNISNLLVYGNTTLFDANVINILTAGNITIQNDTILSLTPTLRLNALEEVDILSGALTVRADGSVIVSGPLIAKGGIETNEISSLNGNSLSVILGTRQLAETPESQDSGQARVTNAGKLSIRNSLDEVANIDNTGAAQFSTLSLKKNYDLPQFDELTASNEAQFGAEVKTAAAAAGSTTLPSYSRRLTIYNDNITEDALIYLSPTSTTKNRTLFVNRQEDCTQTPGVESTQTPGVDETNCTPHFVVEIDDPISLPINFNWWIIK